MMATVVPWLARASRALVARREQRGEIVAVGGDDVEAEGVELRVERLEGQHLLGAADALDAVSIDRATRRWSACDGR